MIECLSKNKRNFDRETTRYRSNKQWLFHQKIECEHEPKNNSTGAPREKAVRKRPVSARGVSWTIQTVSRERPRASWSAPRVSQSISGASPERPRSVPMRPRSLRRCLRATLKRFGFDFGLLGGGSRNPPERFLLRFFTPLRLHARLPQPAEGTERSRT